MSIKVGDRVRDYVLDEGDVLAIAGNEAAVLFKPPHNMVVVRLDHLTPAAPEPEPAALLTVAQVRAIAAELLADVVFGVAWTAPLQGKGIYDRALALAAAERERNHAG